MDFGTSMENFQEELLICRPRDPFAFAVRYFKDEKLPNPEEAHATQMLPYLIFNHAQLQSTLCTIYCHYTMNGTVPKGWLDSTTVWDIYIKMGLETLRLKVKCIDEATQLRIMSLKRIDFNLFLSCIRFPLACYQLVIWLQDKLVLLMEDASTAANVSLLARSQATSTASGSGSKTSTSTSATAAEELASRDSLAGCGCLQLQPLSTVELHRVKMCLQKEQQLTQNRSAVRAPTSSVGTLSQLSKISSNANTIGANSKADRWRRLRSTSYHMHDCPQPADGDSVAHGCGLVFSDSESRSLVQLLVTTVDALVEAGGPNIIDSGVLVEAFMIRYLKKMNSSSGAGSPSKK